MDERETTKRTPSHAAPVAAGATGAQPLSAGSTGSFNNDLLQGTGSIPLAASSTSGMARQALQDTGSMPKQSQDGSTDMAFSTASAPAAPRYVRKRTPHRSTGSLDDLSEDSAPSATYTHDSNISVGGATPLSGMAYKRARSNMSRISNSRYGQYLEIPKGRRSLFASQERARRRRSVLALVVVVTLLVVAAMFLWNMIQQVLG